MEIIEVPMPQLQPGTLLIRNHYSVISAGTEGKTVKDARKGYIAKARSRQKEVKQVLDLMRTQGIKSTYDMVMNKLEALSPLGYSSAGKVIAVADGIHDFAPGDWVACGGNTAVHADVVCVPTNLCIKLPSDAHLEETAFTTIGSIALQGIRQANLQAGSKVAVIGLGLIGIITQKLLKTAGMQSFGVDIDTRAVEMAHHKFGFKAAPRSASGLIDEILHWSDGHGVDAVIITAGTSSLDPVNFAGAIARKKASVVVVGAVPTGFDRKDFYRKELELKMSCSYGPGRYDSLYEEKGIDYPIGYVRWTEKRNMQTITEWLYTNQLSFKDIITHRFELSDAPEAYNLIVEKKDVALGMVIRYETDNPSQKKVYPQKAYSKTDGLPSVGFIGAGSFAQNILLPAAKGKFNLMSICTQKGNTAVSVARKFGFQQVTDHPATLINDEQLNAVFILTRHNTHGSLVAESLLKGKSVFVEKPLTIFPDELRVISNAYHAHESTKLMVGFNRRFSVLTQQVKMQLSSGLPCSINIRVNAGSLPVEHWVNDPEIGGGRIVGEMCHFIDLAIFLAGSKAQAVSAMPLQQNPQKNDTLSVQLQFENGSIATIQYYSNGSKQMPKEWAEVFSGGCVYQIDDFISLTTFGKQRHRKKLKKQDKGHQAEMQLWSGSLSQGSSAPIAFDEILHSHEVTFAVINALREKRWVNL